MAALMVVSAICVGQAVQVANGNQKPLAIAWLTGAFVCLIPATVNVSIPLVERAQRWFPIFLLGLGLVLQFTQLSSRSPGMYLQISPRAFATFLAGVSAAAVVAGASMSEKGWLGPARLPLLLAIHFSLGVWLIKASPSPVIDVYVWHRESLDALLRGHNPYAMTMPNIYGDAGFYAPELVANGRVLVGYPYPPLTLLLSIPGHLAGDYRYTQLAAMTLAAAFMVYARPGILGGVAAALFLFTPRVFFVLEQGWTDPLCVTMVAATVFAACRVPKLLPYALGLLFAVKQYLIFAMPIAFLLSTDINTFRRYGNVLAKAVAVAAVITLPFLVLDVRAFVFDMVGMQALQRLRLDALSYIAFFTVNGISLPIWLGFALLPVAFLVCIFRAPRSPAGFACSIALITTTFFAFGKQAFCNYYFFIIGAICCAISAVQPSPEVRAASDESRGDAGVPILPS